MKKHSLTLAVTLCFGLGFGLQGAPVSAQAADAVPLDVQSAPDAIQTRKLIENQRLQAFAAALANYHRVDAGFSDSLRLARSGDFGLAFLPAPLDMSRDADDADLAIQPAPAIDDGLSPEEREDVSEALENAGADSLDQDLSGQDLEIDSPADQNDLEPLSEQEALDAQPLGDEPDLSWSPEELARLRTELGLDASGQPIAPDSDPDDADTVTPQSSVTAQIQPGGSYRYDPDLGTDELAPAQDLESEIARQSAQDSLTDADDADLGLDADNTAALNADFDDADGFMLAFSRGDDPLVSRLVAHGNLNLAEDGSSSVDLQRLADNIRWRVSADPGARSLAGLDIAHVYAVSPQLQQVQASQLSRLAPTAGETRAGMLDPLQTTQDALINAFGTRMQSEGVARDVILASQAVGPQGPELDMLMQASGAGYGQRAIRVLDPLADGSQHLVTAVKTSIGGSELEMLEDRFVAADGHGLGTGVFELRDRDGAVSRGELRTIQSGGSLYSRLLLGDQVLMLQEDSQGRIQVSLPGTDWQQIDQPELELRKLDD